jgi:hypothetical protein
VGRPPPSVTFQIGKAGSRNFHGFFAEFSQKASTFARHLCPVGANGAMTKRHETAGATAKRPLDAPRHSSGHGKGPNSLIRPPSHAWRARQDSKSGRRGALGTKWPLGRSAAPTESPLHAPRVAPRCGTVCPHTLASAVTHGARRQGPKGGPTAVTVFQYYETVQSVN